jgi:cob(I)alamin adenosyltransferase
MKRHASLSPTRSASHDQQASQENRPDERGRARRLSRRKNAKKKEARNKILATKTEERGLLIVHTGKGKGKSTAAFGMVFRALGHGFKVGVVQFVKGVWETGERDVLDKFPEQVTINAMGEGFTWDVADRQRDLAAARKAPGNRPRL